jgi:glycosyltransferase involved in cell wall biosynthesis
MKVAMLIPDNRDEFQQYDKPSPFFGPAPTALLEGLANRPEIELHVLSCAKRSMLAPEKLSENIWFHLLHVKQWGWLRSIYSGCVLAIRTKLQEIHPDLVHGQGTERYCALAAAFSGFPNVITIHGNMRSITKISHAKVFSYQWCAAKLEQFTLSRVGGVICISPYAQSLASDTARKTWLIPNAVGVDFFKHRALPDDQQNILCVGTICRLKNQNTFIRALDPLAAHRKFRLIFLGAGNNSDPYFKEFQQLVRSRPWCEHQGFVNTEQLKTFFGHAAALALPSLEDNCPMVILEAAASGVPVMAAKAGGIPSLVQDGHTGILFDPRDPSSMASAAGRYLSDPIFAKRMADNAKMVAEATFHPAHISKQHVEVYRELLDGTKRLVK